MPLGEQVTSYAIAELKNEVVDHQQVVKFTTESGHQVFIGFPDQPPTQWLTVTETNTTAYLEQGEFDRIPHLLQSETPLFFTSGLFFGPVFNLSTGSESSWWGELVGLRRLTTGHRDPWGSLVAGRGQLTRPTPATTAAKPSANVRLRRSPSSNSPSRAATTGLRLT